MPEKEFGEFSRALNNLRISFRDTVVIDPRLKQLGEKRLNEFRDWFDSRLEDAIEAAEEQDKTGPGT